MSDAAQRWLLWQSIFQGSTLLDSMLSLHKLHLQTDANNNACEKLDVSKLNEILPGNFRLEFGKSP